MLVSMLPIGGVSIGNFEELVGKYGDEQEFFVIPEFKFDHVLCNFPKNVTARGIGEFYLMGVEKLKLEHRIGIGYLGCGINIVITAGFMMLVPIYRPYATVSGRNLYPDPLWYVGLQTMAILPKTWPETAGEEFVRSPFELLEYCSVSSR